MNASTSILSSLVLSLVACGSAPEGAEDTATTTTTSPAGSPSTTSATAPDTGAACELTQVALAVDEVSAVGFAAIDVDAVLAGERSNEYEHADGALTTVHVAVVPSLPPVFLDWSQVVAGAACPEDALEAYYDVTVTTDDGVIGLTVPYTFHGAVLPEDLFLSEYPEPGSLTGSLPAPAGAQSLSVVVHDDRDGATNGVLQWIIGGGGGGGTATGEGPLTEETVGAWGAYR